MTGGDRWKGVTGVGGCEGIRSRVRRIIYTVRKTEVLLFSHFLCPEEPRSGSRRSGVTMRTWGDKVQSNEIGRGKVHRVPLVEPNTFHITIL